MQPAPLMPPAAEGPPVGTALATTASPAMESLAGPPVSGPGVRRLAKVRFWLKYRAEWGQRLKVIGSHEELGGWWLKAPPGLSQSLGLPHSHISL